MGWHKKKNKAKKVSERIEISDINNDVFDMVQEKTGDNGEKKTDEYNAHKGYAELVKKNDMFETYYKAQKIVPEGEWDVFMSTLAITLPSAFRITSDSVGHANALRNIIESDQFAELVKGHDGSCSLKCLPWYPDRLAWTFSVSREEIKKSDKFRKLHNFFISEVETVRERAKT